MVKVGSPRHEIIDARVWSPNLSAWWSLAPWNELQIDGREDWEVDQATITLSADHPQVPRLRMARHVPIPVSFEINGVIWDGYVSTVETGQRENGEKYVTVVAHSEHKHFTRLLARGPVTSAADNSAETVRTSLGALTKALVATAAVRTGLPTYTIIDHQGDPVEAEIRTEDYIADILTDRLAGSDSFVQVRKLKPGQKLPGVGTAYHYEGAMERQYEAAQLAKGVWPNATTNPRIVGANGDATMATPMPMNSWDGTGSIDNRGNPLGTAQKGVCWLPFETVVDRPIAYYQALDPTSVHVSTTDALRTDMVDGRPMHVTRWAPSAFAKKLSIKLEDCATRGLLRRTGGQRLTTAAAAYAYIGAGEAFAWREGPEWVLANRADFDADNTRYKAAGSGQRQTPGVLVWQHAGRDRRGVVFSSTPGGGLKAWSTTETAPDGAMLIAGGQLDEQTIAALASGTLTPSGTVGSLDVTAANALMPSGTSVPGTVTQVDVDVQPQATISGTEVSFSTAGGRVDITQAGPFFLREKYMSLSSTGGTNPVSEITREWASSQGTTSMAMTPGHHQTVVFGDDVTLSDGRIVPGWKPGDRVSFVDQETRISEVIMGYSLTDNADSPLTVVPVLGRQVNGVLSDLASRLRSAEKTASKALLSPPRKVPRGEVVDISNDTFTLGTQQWKLDINADMEQARAWAAEARKLSEQAGVFSQQSHEFSEQSLTHSKESSKYSDQSLAYSKEAAKYSDQASQFSQQSHEASARSNAYSEESLRHSQEARSFSEKSLENSATARSYSDAANSYSLAASASAEDAETARKNAEEARRLAENARADAEDQRAGAESARDEAEQKRAAAEAARDQAETARDDAEQKRAGAESERALAEEARKNAESARDEAEGQRAAAESARDEAEQKRAAADSARSEAVSKAVEAANEASYASYYAKRSSNSAEAAARSAYEQAQDAKAVASSADAAAAAASRAASANASAIAAQNAINKIIPRIVHLDSGSANIFSPSIGGFSTGNSYGTVYWRTGGGVVDRGTAVFSAYGSWTGVILFICVADGGQTDITAQRVSSYNREFRMSPGGLLQAYKSATVMMFPTD